MQKKTKSHINPIRERYPTRSCINRDDNKENINILFQTQKFDQQVKKQQFRKFGREISQQSVQQVESQNLKPVNIPSNCDQSNIPNSDIPLQKSALNNPQDASIYHSCIFSQLMLSNSACLPMAQSDLSEQMRSVLIDWLVEVHLKFRLVPETLFMTVRLIDKVLEKKQIARQQFQLLGVTALFISSKMQEIQLPDILNFIYITDNSYTVEQMVDMEAQIMILFDFKINYSTRLDFYQFYQKWTNLDLKQINLSLFILELSLVDKRIRNCCQNQIAASTVYLVKKINCQDVQEIINCSNFDESILYNLALLLCDILKEQENYPYQSVKQKFASEKYGNISYLKIKNQ